MRIQTARNRGHLVRTVALIATCGLLSGWAAQSKSSRPLSVDSDALGEDCTIVIQARTTGFPNDGSGPSPVEIKMA